VSVRIADITQRLHAVKKFLDPPLGPDAPPLEIRAAVVDAIAKQVVILGLERRVFPYDRIVVRVLAPPDKLPLEKVFTDLEPRVRDRLREIRCDVPHALSLRVSFLRKAPPRWTPSQLFSIDYGARRDDVGSISSTPSSLPLVRVTVLKGTATKKVYVFREPIILIGRTAEPTDTSGRVRRNHVAFDDRNSTVSRAHARLKYDKARAEYRLLDEGSRRGTRVVRGETLMRVPRDPRGVRIRSGDEIQCGDASVRVTLE